MAKQSPLRRWKRFFRTFETIDAAIVASDPAGDHGEEAQCAEVLRHAKGEVVQLLCDAPEDYAAEDLCAFLDNVMVEYLVTLKAVPVAPSKLASTGLAKAVGALEEHESEQVRGLARDILGRWRASVESDLAEARARVEELDKLSNHVLAPKSRTSTTRKSSCHAEADDGSGKKRQASDAPPCETKSGRANTTNIDKTKAPAALANDHARLEATKRKLRAGYEEAADAKRQRRIQVIEPPKLLEQRRHPILRERSRARCGVSTAAAKRSLMPAFQRI